MRLTLLPPSDLPTLATTCLLATLGGFFSAEILLAHGSISTPASRIYKCRFEDNPENPQDPACAAAVVLAGDPQFLYDWAAVRQGDANGQHQMVVPDGQLCGGGGAEYAGLDLPRDDWRATSIEPESDGTFEFIYHATAPHSTQDMLFYITPEGWDPLQPLTWADLDFLEDPSDPNDPIDPFCHLTSVTLETMPGVGDVYRMVCPLPARTGRHVIFHVWQRDDSPEAFYACVDVVMGSGDQIFQSGFETGDTSEWPSSSP
ncbi:MAG: lytic polysaccharide monooxygenase [Deltaproteobacteria bacterium]|nr:lytic polysaccharide monooxygenase [Deltaproteobacteria bacterium]